MTQEEKAKAYDEAIRITKKNYKMAQNLCEGSLIEPDCLKITLTDIFPELEGEMIRENEKIRKDLIAFLDDIWHLGKNANFDKWGKSDCSDWILWLEKQCKKVDVIEGFDTEFEKQVSHLLASVLNKDYEYTEGFVKWVSSNLLGYAKYELVGRLKEEQKERIKEQNEVKKVDFAKEFDDFTEYLGITDKFMYFSDIEQTAKFFFPLPKKKR